MSDPTMDCRELEDRLEALLDGVLSELERRRCERHIEGCRPCRELAEPLAGAAAPPDGLLEAVMARTSGPACDRAEALLGGWMDGELVGAERALMAEHLDACAGCRSLAAALERLARELPRLAELRPGPGFVEAVLRATLPARVRLRRWWAAAWPRWVRRPRFASETAFVATTILLLVGIVPGSPLAALPSRALDLARGNPANRLEAPMAALEEGLDGRLKQPLIAGATAAARAADETSQTLASKMGDWFGTSSERLASLFASADDKASDADDQANHDQETP